MVNQKLLKNQFQLDLEYGANMSPRKIKLVTINLNGLLISKWLAHFYQCYLYSNIFVIYNLYKKEGLLPLILFVSFILFKCSSHFFKL